MKNRILQAQQAGYSESEIIQHLSQNDPKVTKAKASGYNDFEILSFLGQQEVKPQQPQMGRGEAAFITATNPLNFGDEIKAGISALTAKIMGGASTKDIDIGDLYLEARTNERTKLKQVRQDYPSMTGMIETPSNLVRGAAKGLEEVGSGIYQTAADFGADFSGAKKILSAIRPDLKNEIESLTPQDISSILGEKAAQDSKAIEQEGSEYKTGRFVGKVAPFLGVGGASKVGMAVGGGLAGGSELMEDSGVGKRLGYAAVGAVVTPVVGTAVQKVAPYVVSGVQNIASKAKKVTSNVKNLFTKDTAEEVGAKAIDPESAKLALKELIDKPSDKPLTAVDIQNPEFKTFARSVVSKYPQAREIVKDFTDGRNKQAFTRINDDLKIISKVDNADDYIKQISDTQKSLASPLYAEAEADRTIVPRFEFKEVKTTTSPKTITVSEGVKSFKTDSNTKSKTDFINKYSLESKSRGIEKPLVSQEEKQLFSQGKGSLDTTKEELFNIHNRYKTALKDLKEYAPKNPLQFIKEQGGIVDEAGELKNLGINNKTIPGLLRKEGSKGISLDDVGNKLYEAKYFQERPSVNQVLDFINQEVRNKNIGKRSTPFSGNTIKYQEAKQFLDEADSLGIDIDAIEKLKRISPQTIKTGVAGIKAGSSYDKRNLSKKGIEEFQNTLRKQTTTIQEGGKSVNIRKNITNLAEMSPKSRELAKQYDELENNKIYSKFKTQARERLDEDIPDNSVAMLHKIRKRIDADTAKQYDSFGKPIDKDAIADNSKLRKKIDGLISEISPAFKQADEAFKPLAIKKEAVEFGKEFTKYEPSEIIKKINEFTSKSGLKRQDILDDVKVGAKDIILKDVEQLIKFDSSNIPTEIQVKKIIENKFKRDQLKTFLGEKDYGEFIDNINKEALFNKVSKSLGLTKPSTQEESTNFILRAFNSLISYVTSSYGKYAAITNATKAGEQFLVKNYRGLNPENAKEIARIITNKNASIKYLENIINKASKEQKPFVSQAVTDLKQLDKFSGIIAANTLDFGIDDANAEDLNTSQDQIRQQLLQLQKKEPVLMQGINPEQEAQKIKNHYYRD